VQEQGPTRVEYSRLSPKHRLRAWVQLLALTACRPDRPWKALTLARGTDKKSPPVMWSVLGPVEPDEAEQLLDELVAIHRLGLTMPLPAPPKTSCAYATSRAKGMPAASALAKAGQSWFSKSSQTGAAWGEHDDGDHRRVGLATVDDLTTTAADAVPLDNPGGEPHLFGLLATRIWTPLLAKELILP
jgi:exodeoxyribonuclease V gamma subunit